MFLTNLFCEESNEIFYSIAPVTFEKKLTIELIFQGNRDGLTELEIPVSWTGKPFEEITNLEVSSKTNKLEVESSLDSIIIFHEPHEEIRIKYDVANLSETQDIHSAYFQDNVFFRFTGDCVFITPKLDSYEKRNIILEWRNLPSNWSIANSFGIQEVKQELNTSLFSLRLGLFVGGEISITKSKDTENAPYIAMLNSEQLSQDRLLPLLHTIVESQRDFWNDHDFSHFLVAILPSDIQQGIRAEAKLNAFIAFFPPLLNEEDWKSLAWVLTHEHFHTWNPFKMLPFIPQDFDSLAWFTEGFTEYYTAILCYRTQILNFDEYVKEINNFLYSYYTSPFRNVTNDHFQKERWKDPRMQLLPYQRGFLMALFWDSKIRQRTKEKYSLDNVMHDLLQRAKKTGNPPLIGDIQEIIGKYLEDTEESVQDIQDHIIIGKTIVPLSYISKGQIDIQWCEYMGFNLKLTEEKGIVKGVIENSNAYRAGLRNGQEFQHFYRNNENITVIVNENMSDREISYASNDDILIPQYIIP